MADSGDYIQINDAPNGQVLGHFTVFDGYPILLFSEQFYIRYKTNAAKESKGFNITWSVATIKDTLTVNCENRQWGAAVNLTSLKYLHKDAIRPDKMIISFQNCTGMIYDDLVLFQQHYDDCGSSKTTNDTYDFVIYRNEIVYLDHGIRKWTAPLECKKQRTTRIAHYHLYPNKRFVLSDEKIQGFNFSVNFFYDWVSRISDKNPYAFKQFYFYEITLLDKDPDLTFTVERCSSNHHKNGKRLFRNLINNARAVSNDVSLTKLSRERALVGISIKEDLATEFSCDVKIILL
ncbi:uncharacterized protein LOC127723000 [Mytilus californianus]|uniref:uncharacterized protein LOC127723000 n=1 Tax=Mytilus californianus TaxID=6549 RepID=UPI0022450BC1|nr:uncharacterized protein LOC127723000 [Mytilus californianus]